MKKTLVTVAQRAKARFFRVEAGGARLVEIEDLIHPESRLHEGDLTTDQPGVVEERTGPSMRSYGNENQAKEHEAQVFAKEVAEAIAKQRVDEHYERVVIAAEPGFLGLLREKLDPATARIVDGEHHHELTELKTEEIAERIRDVVRG